MCTVTWIYRQDGYTLFCNRDEKHTRAEAASPRLYHAKGVRFIAPVDGEAGGTWLVTNEYGVTCCLLNGPAPRTNRQSNPVSRGLLVLGLAGSRSVRMAFEHLRRLDLGRFAPFVLAVLEPAGSATVIEWNRELRIGRYAGKGAGLLASSSVDAESVCLSREAELARLSNVSGLTGEDLLLEFHRSHRNGPSAHSPCMHRLDARTVSLSRVRVTPREIEFRYEAGSPCLSGPSETKGLPRVAKGGLEE